MNNEKLREEIRQVVQACPFGPLTELLNRCYVALSDPAAQHARDSAELRSLCAERDRLRAELGKANSQTAHFEREWYLRGDEIEALTAKLGEQARCCAHHYLATYRAAQEKPHD